MKDIRNGQDLHMIFCLFPKVYDEHEAMQVIGAL